jgi:hypothetical protein
LTSAAPPKAAFLYRKGLPCVLDEASGRAGNSHYPFGDEGLGRAGLVLVDGRSGLGVDNLACAGLGFLECNGIAWIFISSMGTCGLLLGFLEPLSGVDFCFDWRGFGLGCGWGGAAGNQSFDGYDQRNGLDLAGDGAPGYFVAEIGELPEPGQDLDANKVLIGDGIFGHGESVPRLLKIGGAELLGFV